MKRKLKQVKKTYHELQKQEYSYSEEWVKAFENLITIHNLIINKKLKP